MTDRLLTIIRLTLCDRYTDRLSDAYYKLITTHCLMIYIYRDQLSNAGEGAAADLVVGGASCGGARGAA
jgi:hypothetical protein